jgi:ankyrin repeat protein
MSDLISSIAASMDALLAAILQDDIARVRELIASGAKSRSIEPLAFAAQNGRTAIAELLLDSGVAQVNSQSPFKMTPCLVAASRDHLDVVRMLIRRGADLSIADGFGRTPLVAAIKNVNPTMVLELIEAGAPLTDDIALQAATVGTDVIALLIKRRVDIASLRHSSSGRTACHLALTEQCPLAVLQMLVNVAGVDINATDSEGQTCVHLCATHGADHVLQWLINAGAEIDTPDADGETPLHYACRQHSAVSGCALQLIVAGADARAQNRHRTTPCFFAAQLSGRHATEVVTTLLAAGGDFDAVDIGGSTPRAMAEFRGDVEPSAEQVDATRRRIVALRLAAVRERAFQVCVALRALDLDALCMCEILTAACGRIAHLIPFHIWWRFATAAKHLALARQE